jgi:hypothetical protein
MIFIPSPAIFFGITLLVVTTASALGINCRGSGLCPQQILAPTYIDTILKIATGLVFDCDPKGDFDCGPMADTDIYAPGSKIICLPQGKSFLGGICAFTQGNVAALYGVVIKRKLQELSNHGCGVCGSVPIGDNNDPGEAGILTVNYVSNSVCAGLCPPTHYSLSSGESINGSSLRLNSNESIETA